VAEAGGGEGFGLGREDAGSNRPDGFYYTSCEGYTTGSCANFGCGTIFKLSVGLGPFVETEPTSGAVGAAVTTWRDLIKPFSEM
jgi:hypothetical protein